MTPLVSLREALADDELLGRSLPGPSWEAWRTILLATLGEVLTTRELEIFKALTGRSTSPTAPCSEVVGTVGRRGGKTKALSTLCVYLATLVDYTDVLVPGERGVALFIGPDQRQARIALNYCEATIEQSPVLSALVQNKTQETIELSNGVNLEVRAASFRRNRGISAVAILADESAFFATDEGSANPDSEILNALRPALATTGGPLVIASSPYRKQGELWNLFKRHYGQEDDQILVFKGTSRELNPSLSQTVVDRALDRDPIAARAEYLAEFRSDIEIYISVEAVDACIDEGVRERPASNRYRYFAAIDPAGGSGTDSMTLAIAHMDGDTVIVDAIREQRPPFSPDATVTEFCTLLHTYGIRTIVGDRWAGEFVREPFRQLGIRYELSEKPKSVAYIEALPRLNSGTIRLLDSERLKNQLIGLERRHGRSGRDTIDHPPHGHDDLANVVMLLTTVAAAPKCGGWGVIDVDGRITMRDNTPKKRSWSREPGISAVDGTRKELHKA